MHTPGPWKYVESLFHWIRAGDNTPIAIMKTPGPNVVANAALIAAAPDMADELTRLRSDNAKLREALEYVRDLARTGCAPEAFNATPFEWLKYKNDAVARRANKTLEEKAL